MWAALLGRWISPMLYPSTLSEPRPSWLIGSTWVMYSCQAQNAFNTPTRSASDFLLLAVFFCCLFTLNRRRTTPSKTSHFVLPLTPMQPIRNWRGCPPCDGQTQLVLDDRRPSKNPGQLGFPRRSHLAPLPVLVQTHDHLHVASLLPHPSFSARVVQQHV